MASYSQDKQSKLWSVRFRIVADNKEVNKRLSGFKQKKEAQSAYISFMSTYVAPPKINEYYVDDYHFNELLKKYLRANASETKDATQYEKEGNFALHIIPFFNNIDIRKINKTMLYDFQEYLWHKKTITTKKEYSYQTLTKIRGFLNNFLEWCSYKYDITNHLKNVKLPKNNKPIEEMKIWEVSEFSYFNENAYTEYYFDNEKMLWETFFLFMFYSGLRKSECLALCDKDIIDNNKISVTKSLTRKTMDNSLYKITATKNYKNRKVPAPEILQRQLANYLLWKKDNNISSTFLFGGNDPLGETTIRRRFDWFLAQVNATLDDRNWLERIRLHDLRHSYVSMLVHMNISTKTIAKLIGDTEEQVIKTYSHLYKDDENIAIEQLNNLLPQLQNSPKKNNLHLICT